MGQVLPIVQVKDNQVFTNSRDVAVFFGKRHDHVLRDIRNILLGSPNLGSLSGTWFMQLLEFNIKARKNVASYDITKDGFTLLVMGYTGRNAMEFKLAYIQKFNEMEATLKDAAVNLDDPEYFLTILL